MRLELDLVEGVLVFIGGPRHGVDLHAGQDCDGDIRQCWPVGDFLLDASRALHVAKADDRTIRVHVTSDERVTHLSGQLLPLREQGRIPLTRDVGIAPQLGEHRQNDCLVTLLRQWNAFSGGIDEDQAHHLIREVLGEGPHQ